jgi:hypothetical protein
MKHLECNISDLMQGCRYYFRVACGNLKGYGNFRLSSPASVIPSSKLGRKSISYFGKRYCIVLTNMQLCPIILGS